MAGDIDADELASEDALYFKVSTGLKRIIGRDLITSDFVAIFELVKNSFDAHATNVEIYFGGGEIVISDDGKGMSLQDLQDKWLFVAYSAKKDGSEDANYRDNIKTNRKSFAGSKGVGRFSCDRLGSTLRLQSKILDQDSVESIEVDWELFENDLHANFDRIPIAHSTKRNFDKLQNFKFGDSGTVLRIGGLREAWPRYKLLELRSALAKLINPFDDSVGIFQVRIVAPDEVREDCKLLGVQEFDEFAVSEAKYPQVVNGPIRNFIFDTLKQKTTYIDVSISADGSEIISELIDRGETVYRIRENNDFTHLKSTSIRCQLFYLNQSARLTFARRMGVPSVQFGSIFLFRNGFRVYPVGEENDDSFGLDRRKQQGFARYLGTREVIGRIDVQGSDQDFQESTSRDQGLIKTPAYVELEELFHSKALRRLERYVVDVSWKDKADKNFEDLTRMLGDTASARITEMVSRLANSSGVKLEAYSERLVRILSERSEQFEDSVASMKQLAASIGDTGLEDRLKVAEERYFELKRSEDEARQRAEKERSGRLEAEGRAKAAEAEAAAVREALAIEQARSLFLTSVSNVDPESVMSLHHQILIYAGDLQINIANQIEKINNGEDLDKSYLRGILIHLDYRVQQILQTSRFATKANFQLDSEQIEEDICRFITQYLERIAPLYGTGITIRVTSTTAGLIRRFKPIEVTIVLENLISNASKAGASDILFSLTQPKENEVDIVIEDDGHGISEIIQPPERIFDIGVTTTDGSGLGLHHVSRILDAMGASIEYDSTYRAGARFKLRIFK